MSVHNIYIYIYIEIYIYNPVITQVVSSRIKSRCFVGKGFFKFQTFSPSLVTPRYRRNSHIRLEHGRGAA